MCRLGSGGVYPADPGGCSRVEVISLIRRRSRIGKPKSSSTVKLSGITAVAGDDAGIEMVSPNRSRMEVINANRLS